ncbi:MAG: hypothetical protein JRG76_02535 [Deltaproteobacteria bacterium]|nr:hypothetical protein [Deltaproteobacteria bacterium]MBW2413365.1 hypothetical protein [Deltaproteobacteria bacterium]
MAFSDDMASRLGYLDLTDDDRDALRGLRPLLEEHAESFVAAFYRHLLSFEATRVFLLDPQVKDRLLDKQREYLLSLGDASFDDDYVDGRIKIGEAHERVGLEPRWYLGAYALYLRLLTPIVIEHYAQRPGAAEGTLNALIKVLMLDAQIAMEAYIRSRQQQLEFLTQELAESSRQLGRAHEEQSLALRATTQRAVAAERLASIGTLVAGLAHEIGTPMGVIQGHAEMLESSVPVSDERGRWRLRTIRDQIERISGIIQTLLNIARPREPEHAPVELRETVSGCLEFLAEKLRRRGIEVCTDMPFAATLDGDRQKLQQVFLNLFLNAADAMPEGGKLSVSMVAAGADGEIEIHISDTGHGIPEASLTRIFEPFYSTKPAGQGSGLGLMVAQDIVHEHGGSIRAHSDPDQGTEFVLQVPARRE